MTRKDYVALARALAEARKDISVSRLTQRPALMHGWQLAVLNVSEALAADNPRFDRRKFREACEA